MKAVRIHDYGTAVGNFLFGHGVRFSVVPLAVGRGGVAYVDSGVGGV